MASQKEEITESGYLENLYQRAFKREGVLNHLIDYQCAVQCPHYLVDIYCYSIAIGLETLGIHSGIDEFPLAGPIISNSFVAVNIASFHTVCPNHIRTHADEATIDVAGVEGSVELG